MILKEDYPSLGYVGDRVSVRNGFARNFLIPRNIAVETNSRRAKMLKHQLDAISARRAKKKKLAEEYARELGAVVLGFSLKSSGQGKSFGSIGVRDIEKALSDKGHNLDRKQIKLGEPIKKPGVVKVGIKLHSEVVVELEVKVEGEVPAAREKKSSAPGQEAELKTSDPVSESSEA